MNAYIEKFCNRSEQINTQNLMMLLSDNKDTEIGRQYGFAEIHDVDTYRKTVPLADYSAFEERIQRMREGETNLLTVYPVASYCRTSGTTGPSKFIPVTYKALEQYADYVVPRVDGKRLFINAFRTDLSKPIAPTVLFSEVHHRFLYEHGYMDMEQYIGGEPFLFVQNEEDILYAKIWLALAHPELRLIEGIFMYELLTFFSYLELHWEDILADMETNTIPSSIRLSERLRALLTEHPVPRKRLSEISEECNLGFTGIASRLWKELVYVSGISDRTHLTEQDALDDYLGDIPKFYFSYCASECCFGMPRDYNDFGHVLLPPCGFFEFLPYSEDSEATVLPHECEVGQLYELVVTNFSGLYRYKMGDIVKITDICGNTPVMEFMFRRGQVLNIAGEKFDARQLDQAMYALRKHGITVGNYCAAACLDSIPGHYVIMLTLREGSKSIRPRKLRLLLDQTLSMCNPEYDDLRNLGQLDLPVVYLCDEAVFSEFMVTNGLFRSHGHNKPRHILKEEVHKEQWESIIKDLKTD